MKRLRLAALALLPVSQLLGCGSSDDDAKSGDDAAPMTAFELKFALEVDGKAVGCTDDLSGFGPMGSHHVGINDARFYVSNLTFRDASGAPLDVTLDQNEFQLVSADGTVSLVDLTGVGDGTCTASSVAYAEGTARTHAAITGKSRVSKIASVSFDVGVPQILMKKTIAGYTPEGAPSPLSEMYWNWNSGYRHFVFNFSVKDGAGKNGEGYVHVGSRDCAAMDTGKALTDRDACTYVNTPKVDLPGFDVTKHTVGIDVRRLLKGIDFVSPVYDPTTFEVIGEGPGVECHSSPMQPDCGNVFANVGLALDSGVSMAPAPTFVKLP